MENSEGVTDTEIETAVKVIKYLNANLDVYKSSSCRSLRMALQPLINLQKDSMFSGTDAHTQAENKRKNARRKQEAHRSKMEDEKLIQKTVLRAGRMQKLQQIADSNGSDLPAVLDGVVEDGFNSTVLCADDSQTKAIEHQKANAVPENPPLRLNNFRSCYICKRRFQDLHHFYDSLCPSCANLNWMKRMQTCDMSDRVCLVTGGRVKIGFQCCLKLLRCGATVIATSRFPVDTAKRFSVQKDFEDWKDRIHVYGLDLRDLAYVEAFCEMTLRTYQRLDVIINNACQTIRRPTAYYSHMMNDEESAESRSQEGLRTLLERDSAYVARYATLCNGSVDQQFLGTSGNKPLLSDGTSTHSDLSPIQSTATPLTSAALSQVPLTQEDSLCDSLRAAAFPSHARDINQQQLDLRRENSWLLRMHQVSSPEVAEVFAINSISPFIMVARLKPLLVHGKTRRAAQDGEGADASSSQEPGSKKKSNKKDSQAHSDSSSAPLLSLAESILLEEKRDTRSKDDRKSTDGAGADDATSFDTAHGARAPDVSASDCSFVVNVSSMEGKFYRRKMASHPHTNMAKAALNMMTRTVAGDYRDDNIFMTAVDTG